MRECINKDARLSCRIFDLKRRIAEEERRVALESMPWDTRVRSEIVELMEKTLKDLEARMVTLQSADQEQLKK